MIKITIATVNQEPVFMKFCLDCYEKNFAGKTVV